MRRKILLKGVYYRYLILIAIMLFNSFIAFSQEIKVSGIVVDSLNYTPLIGVSVLVKGTDQGTITDSKGRYTIDAGANSTLVFRTIGYKPKQVIVGEQKMINIKLVNSSLKLDQVVVVGYGTEKKVTMTESVSTLEGKEITSVPSSNISNNLAGRLSGVIAKQASGRPGEDGSNIIIRGISTTGSTQPLIVVDGVRRQDFTNIDPNNVVLLMLVYLGFAVKFSENRREKNVFYLPTARHYECKFLFSNFSNKINNLIY